MISELSILYRGQLSSCNYGCPYCPFAKHFESPEELQADKDSLERFVRWAERSALPRLSVFFTPWGEALVRKWYQQAIARLTHLPHVRKVAIQTNLSCSLDWLESADPVKLGIWATFHPGEIQRERFIAKCRELANRGVRYSAGVVGLKEHQAEIESLRRELPAGTYLWINAYKRDPDYYSSDVIDAFTAIDPLFPMNNQSHASLGRPCRSGHTVLSVDGAGAARRCHFIKEPIGNIYDGQFLSSLSPDPSPCTNRTCGCHIGYVHLPHLGLDKVFGAGILERIPDAKGVCERGLNSGDASHRAAERRAGLAG
jgi:hypothetical protein